MTPVSHFPVVGEEGTAVGLLSKDKINREMADLESLGIEYETIPEHLMTFEITDSVVKYFQNHRSIPVLDVFGQRVDTWEKPKFLAECSDLLTKKTPPKPQVQEEKAESTPDNSNKLLIYKFMELILRNFPDALFSTDREGNTTFYNEKFETEVLSKSIFRDSITIAEKYFRELNRDLISEFFKSVEVEDSNLIPVPVLQAYVKNIDLNVRVVTLKLDGKVLGFLYHLAHEPLTSSDKNEENIDDFPSISKAFQEQVYLNDLMKEVEASYILKTFKKNHENISHTANALGIPRSTLQNRIKYLNLNDQMSRDPQIPIPRTRKSSMSSTIDEDFDIEEDEFKEDPEFSQAKKLKDLESLVDKKYEEKAASDASKKNSSVKRKSSSQTSSKKK